MRLLRAKIASIIVILAFPPLYFALWIDRNDNGKLYTHVWAAIRDTASQVRERAYHFSSKLHRLILVHLGVCLPHDVEPLAALLPKKIFLIIAHRNGGTKRYASRSSECANLVVNSEVVFLLSEVFQRSSRCELGPEFGRIFHGPRDPLGTRRRSAVTRRFPRRGVLPSDLGLSGGHSS